MEKSRSVIVGASGLTGGLLLNQLAFDDAFQSVDILVRRNINIPTKVVQHITAFRSYDFKHYPEADIVFCCLGTTIKKAGSRINFELVDFDIPLKIAQHYHQLGAHTFVLQSSVGADEHSQNFYLQVKGKLEHALQEIGFKRLIIVRPSLLLGKRQEFRFGEKIGRLLAPIFNVFMQGKLSKYKAIKAEEVAKSMIKAVKTLPDGVHIMERSEMDEVLKTA